MAAGIGTGIRGVRAKSRNLGMNTQINIMNFTILGLTLFVLYYRYVKRPLEGIPGDEIPVPLTGAVVFLFFVIIAVAALVRGVTWMRREVYGFNTAFERDPGRLPGLPAREKARLGVAVMNWPVTSFLLTVVVGGISVLVAYFAVKIFVYKGTTVPTLGLPVLLDPWVLIIMCGFFTYFCNAIFVPPMVSRLVKSGFPIPGSGTPRLIRLRLQTKLSLAFLVVIVFIGYLISTDLSALLRSLGAFENVPDELVRAVEHRVVVNTLLVSLYSAFMVFFAVKSVTVSLGRIVRGTQRVSAGDLDHNAELVPVSVDRLGDLGRMIGQIRVNLSRQLSQINEQSERMAHMVRTIQEIVPLLVRSTEEMRDVSRKQEEGVHRQLEKVRKILADNDRLSGLSDEISENVGRVVRQAGTAARKAGERGTKAITDSRENIDGVAARVGGMEKRIRTLSGLGKDVERILDTIEEISARGDILALNATLQGAGVGSAGTGFIKIAERMRTLSVEVVRETDHIRPIIQQIEIIAGEIMQVIDLNLKETEAGSVCAAQANSAFGKIYELITGTNEAARDISQGAQLQKDLTDEMVLYMRKVAETAEEGSLLCRDSTEAAERLVHMSDTLKSLAFSETFT